LSSHEKTTRDGEWLGFRLIGNERGFAPVSAHLALIRDVEAAASGALAVHEFATVLGLHAGAETDGSNALDAAGTVWVMHRKNLDPVVPLTLVRDGP
jgi:hypothetical protein